MFLIDQFKILTLMFLIFGPVNATSNKTSKVDIMGYSTTSSIELDKPDDNLNYRECLEDGYPRTRTTCRCTVNYPKEIKLISYTDEWWVREGNDFPCTDGDPKKTSKLRFEPYSSTYGVCNKPQERLEIFQSCEDIGYPKSETTCFCTYNYPKTVILKCNSNQWYIENFQEQCKASSIVKTSPVYLGFYTTSSAKCSKPEELVNIYHSCENKVYPAEKTSCICTYNPENEIYFNCATLTSFGLTWVRDGPATPCKYNFNPKYVHCFKKNGDIVCQCRKNCFPLDIKANLTFKEIDNICNSNTLFVRNAEIKINYDSYSKSLDFKCAEGHKLLDYNNAVTCNNGIISGSSPKCIINTPSKVNIDVIGKIKTETCKKPERNDLIYHSCKDDVSYPTSQTSCVCTINYPLQIQLQCSNQVWYRATDENPCELGYMDPDTVIHTYENGENIHRCKNNCAVIKKEQKLSHKEIVYICSDTVHYYTDHRLVSYFNDTSKLLKFVCEDPEHLKLVGTQYIQCNNGILNETLPTCETMSQSIYHSLKELMVYKVLTFTLVSLLLLALSTIMFFIYKIFRQSKTGAVQSQTSNVVGNTNCTVETPEDRNSVVYDYIEMPVRNKEGNKFTNEPIASTSKEHTAYVDSEYANFTSIQGSANYAEPEYEDYREPPKCTENVEYEEF